MELDELLQRLEHVQHQPSGISARCPSHADSVNSLSVDSGRNGGIVVRCHANCRVEDVMSALGLRMSDLAGKPHVVETYVYTDDSARPIYSVQRWANPKTFKCVPGLPPVAERRLYRAEALAWARQRGAQIWIVEGERDANRLADLGLVSTTNCGGAGKFYPHYAEQIAGCPVTIISDNDAVGRQHARQVAEMCAPFASSVLTLLPRYGKDVSDLLDLGWTLDALDPLPATEGLAAVSAANVVTRPVTWAWPGYIPFGAVCLFEGDPGDGKSIMSMDLAARWSSGAPLPDGSRHDGPYRVLAVSAEDDLGSTVVPRLRSAGADLRRVELVTHGSDPSKPFTISTDMPALARHVLDNDIKIILFDPLMAFVGDETDSHNDHAVRRALFPLFALARDTGAAVITIRHLNKGQGKAVYRGGGSIAFIGAARSAYTIGRDAEDPERRVMACVKMNIARQPASLAYSINDSTTGPILEWHGTVDADAQRIVDGGHYNPDDADILQFLNTIVEKDPMTWKEIVKAGSEDGWSEAQLRRRRRRSRLVKITGGEGNRSTRWGYLDHQVRADTHLHGIPPFSSLTATSPCYLTGGSGADDPVGGPPSHQKQGQEAVDGESGPLGVQMEANPDEAEVDRRDSLLDAMAPICDVCGTVEGVLKYGDPYWVVRCIAHNPEDYGGGK